MKYIIPVILIFAVLTSCSKKKVEKQAAEDDEIIQAYIAAKNLNATKTSTGLYVVIDEPGTGAGCTGTSDVTVSYKGYFTSGEVFDESAASGITFNLSNVIKGWNEGIPHFKEGGNGKLLIPSALGYGTKGNATIPPNTVLIFDVALIDVL